MAQSRELAKAAAGTHSELLDAIDAHNQAVRHTAGALQHGAVSFAKARPALTESHATVGRSIKLLTRIHGGETIHPNRIAGHVRALNELTSAHRALVGSSGPNAVAGGISKAAGGTTPLVAYAGHTPHPQGGHSILFNRFEKKGSQLVSSPEQMRSSPVTAIHHHGEGLYTIHTQSGSRYGMVAPHEHMQAVARGAGVKIGRGIAKAAITSAPAALLAKLIVLKATARVAADKLRAAKQAGDD